MRRRKEANEFWDRARPLRSIDLTTRADDEEIILTGGGLGWKRLWDDHSRAGLGADDAWNAFLDGTAEQCRAERWLLR